jgi:hypothetical protein
MRAHCMPRARTLDPTCVASIDQTVTFAHHFDTFRAAGPIRHRRCIVVPPGMAATTMTPTQGTPGNASAAGNSQTAQIDKEEQDGFRFALQCVIEDARNGNVNPNAGTRKKQAGANRLGGENRASVGQSSAHERTSSPIQLDSHELNSFFRDGGGKTKQVGDSGIGKHGISTVI